ncbi:MAG: Co2+/Mg2+ efflux protein ApaG [Pseudomonadota bacterium]
MTTFPYQSTTNDITVRVRPSYLAEESSPAQNRYVWAYQVEIENGSDGIWTVMARHWHIVDANGQSQQVDGEGVVGQTPTLEPGGVFRYTSGAPLSAPSGIMSGSYDLAAATGEKLSVKIPTFSLDSPYETSKPS